VRRGRKLTAKDTAWLKAVIASSDVTGVNDAPTAWTRNRTRPPASQTQFNLPAPRPVGRSYRLADPSSQLTRLRPRTVTLGFRGRGQEGEGVLSRDGAHPRTSVYVYMYWYADSHDPGTRSVAELVAQILRFRSSASGSGCLPRTREIMAGSRHIVGWGSMTSQPQETMRSREVAAKACVNALRSSQSCCGQKNSEHAVVQGPTRPFTCMVLPYNRAHHTRTSTWQI
jgi:hypothetical protein